MFKLLESNPQLSEINGCYKSQRETFRDTKYNNQTLVSVSEVFDRAIDKSPFGSDLENHLNGDAARAALSSAPYNYLQTLNLSNVQHVLDLSEDFGDTAHYLSDHVATVESVKIDPDLARITIRRCVDRRNVRVILEDLEKLALPTKHYDLVILGCLENRQLDERQLTNLLNLLRPTLNERGVLLVNAQNQNRLSSHYSPQPNLNTEAPDYADLYLFKPNRLDSRAVNLSQLRKLVLELGYAHVDVHGTYSQGNDYSNLFSEDYITTAVDPLNHFYRINSLGRADLSEYLVYRQLFLNKVPLINHASRYLFIIGAHAKYTRAVYDNDFSHYAGTGRKPEWRTNTVRLRAAEVVQKIRKHPETLSTSKLVGQDTSDLPFQKGALLVNYWLDAIIDNDFKHFSHLVETYHNWLSERASNTEEFNRTAYDLLPFNILVTEKNGLQTFKTIDTEWQIKQTISADFVLFRALFWFAFENKSLLRNYAEKNQLFSVGAFITQHAPVVLDQTDLEEFITLEERVQADVDAQFTAGSVRLAIEQSFGSSDVIDDGSIAQAVWMAKDGKTDKSHLASVKVAKKAATQVIELSLGEHQVKFTHLRIDPLSCKGSFSICSLTIIDTDNETVTKINGDQLLENAELVNIQRVIAEPANVTTVNEPLLLAINDDPHLIVAFDDSVDLTAASRVRLELRWVWDSRYSAAIDSLSQELAKRNRALLHQWNTINTLKSENSYQETTLGELRKHVPVLMEYEQIQTHLRMALEQQMNKNDLLYEFLLARPTTRIKAFLSRMTSRLLRRPVHEVDTNLFKPPAPEPEPTPLEELLGQNTEDYDLWVSENDLTPDQLDAARIEIENMAYKPVFSIVVPIYNTDPEYLLPMIRSVQAQIYPHWQLCLVDDCSPKRYLRSILEYEAALDDRISLRFNDVNQGISVTTNNALQMATGDYIALLDHDDEISVDALYQNAKVINEKPNVGLIYSDEDKMDMKGNRLEPFFKPDYSQDLLETNNYICHFTVIQKSIMEQIGGFREGLDGSQDHDVILRAADAAEEVHHIQRILYHWRKIPGSTAVVYDAKSYAWEAGRKSIEDLLRKREEGVRVDFGSLKGTYRIFREIKGNPLVSIVIPFKDKPELLEACLTSILNRSTYANFEIVGVSNNSERAETTEMMERFCELDSRVKFVEHNIPFNFSAICNYGVEHSTGEYVVLLNNDIEIISSDWLERLLEHAQRPEIGAVGGKLLYPDGRIQHAGIVVGMVGAAGHPHKFFPDNHIGYHGRLHMVYNVSAVTGAMLMVARNKYNQVDGLDSQDLAVAYNDVDFCLKLMDAGFTNLFTPHCKATHHESVSRGYEDTPEKLERLLKEQKAFLTKWSEFLEKGDPFYNPNLSLKTENFSLNFRD
ncbi:MAG: glycosyltransferase [Arenicella sp.]|nr:glycosyltransferase [Arenicella sp.]